MSVLVVEDLSVEFRLPGGALRAVDGVSFSLDQGETLCVVGESGSGKTAMALALMRLHAVPPCVYAGGKVTLGNQDLLTLPERSMRQVRGGEIAMIFQDPMTSLNPLKTAGAQIAEAVRVHQQVSHRQARLEAVRALGEVGIATPERRAREYPHQLSGGMRQRVMIAMALACRPKVILADEPTTALDVTIQAQIVELLAEIQGRYGTALVLVTHDLGLVAQMADRVLVMYAGRLVETSPVDELFSQPFMPYTWALLQSMPQVSVAGGRAMRPIVGQPPDLADLPDGCSFSPRCQYVSDVCRVSPPPLLERSPGHSAACVLTAEEFEDRRRAEEQDLKPP